ncbi:MAG TPA: hypothetical protein VNM92_14100 [Thermoanaerobaculia bacterium]|nr:hypothetical protein [Thermoanaerobaculia bacterium]
MIRVTANLRVAGASGAIANILKIHGATSRLDRMMSDPNMMQQVTEPMMQNSEPRARMAEHMSKILKRAAT